MKTAFWFVQVLLALVFLFAGGVKLAMPVAALEAQPPHMSGLFLKFIAVAEVMGALGLILPGLFKIRQGLTPLAAAGLVLIMIGATVTSLFGPDARIAVIPAVVGVLAAFVAYGRWRLG
jgi:DoxX-like protein